MPDALPDATLPFIWAWDWHYGPDIYTAFKHSSCLPSRRNCGLAIVLCTKLLSLSVYA
uniref:Uncharacterized protein n=1 Tax=Anguilla anguilla TaxID=7936 RepID=A0A0E9PWJ8_ANGAN